MKKQFNLRKPCKNCPFRNDDQTIGLQPGRLEDIIEGLLNGEDMTFHCHKTVYSEGGVNFDDNGDFRPVRVSHCAGAAAVCRKHGRDTVASQLAIRLGVILEDHYEPAMLGTMSPSDLSVDKRKARI